MWILNKNLRFILEIRYSNVMRQRPRTMGISCDNDVFSISICQRWHFVSEGYSGASVNWSEIAFWFGNVVTKDGWLFCKRVILNIFLVHLLSILGKRRYCPGFDVRLSVYPLVKFIFGSKNEQVRGENERVRRRTLRTKLF